jgi:hypothetical protein
VLRAGYVGENLDLGYAVTAHRAQGVTVDTSHVVVTASTTCENLYVSMTRGRESNIACVTLDQPDDSHSTPEPEDVSALRQSVAEPVDPAVSPNLSVPRHSLTSDRLALRNTGKRRADDRVTGALSYPSRAC